MVHIGRGRVSPPSVGVPPITSGGHAGQAMRLNAASEPKQAGPQHAIIGQE
jgi:hypothetical protein